MVISRTESVVKIGTPNSSPWKSSAAIAAFTFSKFIATIKVVALPLVRIVWCQHEWDKTGLKVKRYFQSNNG
jgi:hypothetical protein